MMDPEMMRLAQEQMGRMSPGDLAKLQQQFMSNPDLVNLASETMKNMSSSDFKRAAQQLHQTKPEEILRMTENIANAKPEQFAAMKAQADAQMSYAIYGAKMLKQQGNELHGRGQYTGAAAKYRLAKDNVKNVPSAAGQTLQLQCALNLMSCYLKSGRFEECVNEGTQVLAYDAGNVKAYYRRGQAYKLENQEAAVADLSRAHEISPEDETIAGILRDAEGKLAANLPKGVVIEEIVEEDDFQPSSPQNVVTENRDDEIVSNLSMDQPSLGSPPSTTDMQDVMRNSMKDPAMQQMLATIMKNMSPDMMANMSEVFGMNLSLEDAAKAQQAMSELSPEGLHRMMKWMDRAKRGVEVAKKTKQWLIARKGLIIAILLLILAFILHRLFGFIGR